MSEGATVVGGGMQAYGKYKGAMAEADSLEAGADASESEADELLRRSYINAGATLQEGETMKGKQLSGFVSAGVEIDEGTPLTVLEDTNEKITRQIGYEMEATQFTAEQKRRQAQFDRKTAGATRTAGKVAAIGSLVSSGAKASS